MDSVKIMYKIQVYFAMPAFKTLSDAPLHFWLGFYEEVMRKYGRSGGK